MKSRVAYVLAIWFGCGRVPVAPGTAGTAGAIPLYLLLAPHGPIAVAVAALVLTAVGIWAASVVAEETGLKDPQIVVIDEVAGVMITYVAAAPGYKSILAGFVAFRLFDQFKPWPARLAERRLPSGWGIVLDDVVAGIYGALVLLVLRRYGVLA